MSKGIENVYDGSISAWFKSSTPAAKSARAPHYAFGQVPRNGRTASGHGLAKTQLNVPRFSRGHSAPVAG